MQQRVALVRAFALGAPILLMDEPFAALDEITRAEMRLPAAAAVRARSAPTVLFVTHSIAEAVMLSDRVVVMTPALAAWSAVERDRPAPAATARRWRTTPAFFDRRDPPARDLLHEPAQGDERRPAGSSPSARDSGR